MRSLIVGGVTFGLTSLAFASGALCLAAGWVTVPKITLGVGTWLLVLPPLHLSLGISEIRTFVFLAIVFATQAVLYATRSATPLWRSLPGGWVSLSSVVGLGVAIGLAATGTLMAKLPLPLIAGLFGAALVFALLLDGLKRVLFPRLGFG